MIRRIVMIALVAAGCATTGTQRVADHATAASSERPRPYPLRESKAFARAVERGTRTRTGRPGPKYWTNYARYELQARLDPATRRLEGRGTIRYDNRSPDTLRLLRVRLYDNLFQPGEERVEPVPTTEGVALTSVQVDGQPLVRRADDSAVGYSIEGTYAYLRLGRPLAPGGSTRLDVAWSLTIPPDGAPRGGTDGEVFFVSYWYPQVGVYDDVNGWQDDQYLGRAEFYMGYADYDVSITVPAGWLVASTGTLANAADVLTPQTRARLDSARHGDRVVHVVSDNDRVPGRSTLTGRADGATAGQVTWRFTAANVRDFDWGTSDQWLWDATRAIAADSAQLGKGGDTVAINTFYRPSRRAWAWDRSAEYARHSIEFLSRYLWPYPWPQATAADGVVRCSGMEYPMITCIGGQRDTLGLYSVTVHELAHMWFPMQVGSNETRYGWQDEGLTRFNQAQGMREFFHGYDLVSIVRDQYLDLARAEGEVELMRAGDLYPDGFTYQRATYQKMASNLRALRGLLGDSLFLAAYREYGKRWLFKHPQPDDFFNTFEDVSGRDLDWFWRTWWFETWTLDHAVAGVREGKDGAEITVEDRGLAPMPARLAVTHADGRVERLEIPVDAWLGGARRQVVRASRGAAVTRVELDPEHLFPDIDRTNDLWSAP